MNLPKFEEFIESLTQEDKEYIYGLRNDNPPSFKGNIANQEDFKEFIGFIGGCAFGMNLRLLELYHEWLSEHL